MSTPNFSYLKKLHVDDSATARYCFEDINHEPILIVRHAGDSNPEFFNAVMKKSKGARRKAKTAKHLSGPEVVRALEEARKVDVELFVKYIVVGWEDVHDTDGELVEFSPEVCKQFLDLIPLDMFHEFRNFCLDINNFRDIEEMEDEELEELQGN